MTSEAKVAANRRNARRSTGPRTAAGKMRVRRNALRHGLAALVVGDSAAAAEVHQVAAAICGEHADALQSKQALIFAEAQVTLKQIRRTRLQIIEQLLSPPSEHDARDTMWMQGMDRSLTCLNQLFALERYERRAFSREKWAMHLASLEASEKIT